MKLRGHRADTSHETVDWQGNKVWIVIRHAVVTGKRVRARKTDEVEMVEVSIYLVVMLLKLQTLDKVTLFLVSS